jgi:hypothetical protein
MAACACPSDVARGATWKDSPLLAADFFSFPICSDSVVLAVFDPNAIQVLSETPNPVGWPQHFVGASVCGEFGKINGPELGTRGLALREWRWEGTHRLGMLSVDLIIAI